MLKALQSDAALSNVLMPILSASKLALAVVQVDRLQVGKPDDFVELSHALLVRFLAADVISRREHVASVQAHTDAGLVRDAVNDHLELLKTAPHGVSLPSSIFKKNGHLWHRLVHSIDFLRNDCCSLLDRTRSDSGARVNIVICKSQMEAAGCLVFKQLIALRSLCVVRVAQVDQIGAVWNDLVGTDGALL